MKPGAKPGAAKPGAAKPPANGWPGNLTLWVGSMDVCHWSEASELFGAAPSCGKLEGWLSGARVAVLTLMLSPLVVEEAVVEEEKGAEEEEEEEIAGLVSALLPGLCQCT